jgi:hypothetical protein
MSAVGKATVTIQLANGGWALQSMDMIEIDGCHWLVPAWQLSADGATRQPRRIVSMVMADTGGAATDSDAFTGLPIPDTLLFDGHIPLGVARLFVVQESPDIWVAVG